MEAIKKQIQSFKIDNLFRQLTIVKQLLSVARMCCCF